MAKILIVDDSTIQRTILRKYLEKGGHEIIGESKTGNNVLGLYKELMPDLVILDIVMPDANGIAILEQLLKFDKNARIVMCSGTALQNVIIETINMGAKSFLVKPVTGEYLLMTVDKVMRNNNNVFSQQDNRHY